MKQTNEFINNKINKKKEKNNLHLDFLSLRFGNNQTIDGVKLKGSGVAVLLVQWSEDCSHARPIA